ncbi:MAG: sugar-binding protein [Treponema sp.]|nr:sugar-binding protein [Treponema sp.]
MKKSCKYFGIIVMMMIIGFSFAACNMGGDDNDDFDASNILIGIAMPETDVDRWIKDGERLKALAEGKGYRAEVALGNSNQGTQNEQIRDFLSQGAKLIVVANINEDIVPVIAEAKAQGVIIISYDRLITGSGDYDFYVTFDNLKVGQLMGESIADELALENATTANPKNIALFAGSTADNNAKFFFDGAMDILNPYIEDDVLKVIGPSPQSSGDSEFADISIENWDPINAKPMMQSLLVNEAANVTLDAVLAPNDTNARAIIEACKEDTQNRYDEELPLVTGQDAELASIQLIKDGEQYMTVFKDIRELAKKTIDLADMLLRGQTSGNIAGTRKDTSTYNTGVKMVTSYLLEPVSVNQDNYEEILIDNGYINADDLN